MRPTTAALSVSKSCEVPCRTSLRSGMSTTNTWVRPCTPGHTAPVPNDVSWITTLDGRPGGGRFFEAAWWMLGQRQSTPSSVRPVAVSPALGRPLHVHCSAPVHRRTTEPLLTNLSTGPP
eukprot:scaffold1851_cov390-Prasinococcus_capsulatus_cf.AAC.2